MCEKSKSFDDLEMDNANYFYGQLMNYNEQEMGKSKFALLSSFFNFNK